MLQQQLLFSMYKSFVLAAVQVFVGLVVRDHLMVLLRRALARGTTASLDVTYEDLNHQFVTAAARHLIWEQHMAVLQVGTLSRILTACLQHLLCHHN